MNVLEQGVYEQAEFIERLSWEELPQAVKQRATWVVLDSMGCILKGLGGKKIPTDRDDAVIAVTEAMVSTELYEGNRKAVGHPACHILPYLFVTCQDKPMEEFYRAFVAAYEIASRWGAAIHFPNHVLGHGTMMTTGVAAAIAVMQELSTQETYELLLLAASLPQVSVWQSVYDGSRLHDVYAGIAAVVTDHLLPLVKRGVRSDGKIVESVYREVMGAEIFPEKLSKGLEKEYVLCSNYFKVHTGCRFIHPFADALKEELTQGLSRDQVEGIDVFTYKKAAQIGDECVPNDLAAKFSTPVSLAVLLEKGSLSPDSIKNCEKDDAITRWAGKIHLHEDTSYNALLPEKRGGRIELHLKDGENKIIETFHAVGDFDNPKPYTEEDLKQKFQTNVDGQMTAQEINLMEQRILEGQDGILGDAIPVFYEKVGISAYE